MAQRFEEVVVGQLRIVQFGRGLSAPEEAAERGKRQAPARALAVGLARKGIGQQPELAPEVAVARPLDPAREMPQPCRAVVRGVRFARRPCAVGVVARMEQGLPVEGAVLGDEEKDQPVHHAQELAVKALRRERPGPQPLAQRRIVGMAREAPAENPQRPFHAPAQLAERAGALLLGFAGPLLQPAGLGPLALARHEARGMHDEPQQHEVRVDLAGEHRLEVELDIRLAGQGLVVPQDAQAQSVRDDRPQVPVAAVEELLHEAVRVGGGRAALSRRTAVEREAAADEMHRHRAEEPPDGIGAATNLGTGGRGQEPEPQLAQQRQAPLVVGEPGAGLAVGQIGGGGAELAVVPAQAIPGVSDYFVHAFAGGESVVFGAGAGEG